VRTDAFKRTVMENEGESPFPTVMIPGDILRRRMAVIVRKKKKNK
jgi:hypothetical protein